MKILKYCLLSFHIIISIISQSVCLFIYLDIDSLGVKIVGNNIQDSYIFILIYILYIII